MASTKLLLTNYRSYELHPDVADRLADDLWIQVSEYGMRGSPVPGGLFTAADKLNHARSGGVVNLDKDESRAVYKILSRYGIQPVRDQAEPE